MSSGYHEKNDRAGGFIEWGSGKPGSWDEVILHGPHLGPSTPFYKEDPDLTPTGQRIDLAQISSSFIPATKMVRKCDRTAFESKVGVWKPWQGAPHARQYRLAFRRRNDGKTERVLNAAVIPPGATHVDAINTLAFLDNKKMLLTAGFWASLPLDYVLRAFGITDLREKDAQRLPAPTAGHPLQNHLLLRVARLNCLSTAYAPLWREQFREDWLKVTWARDWSRLEPLAAVQAEWEHSTPLRTDYARRAALAETDALVAVWMGLSADALVAAYRARLTVLAGREERLWFDAVGRQLAADNQAYGVGQAKDHWKQFEAYTNDPAFAAHQQDPETNPSPGTPVPDGYTAPFYKANREQEMREAHAYFQKRLDDAVEAGKWDPVKQEVPKP
jgi:hypothetical protein